MKKQLPGFIAGLLCSVILFGVVVGAGALITGPTSISVSPINIMVNGEVFQPKNANGALVDVFEYGGTTYVPLRAIAETLGLEVGYDAEKNLATVGKTGSNTPPKQDNTSATLDFSDWSAEEEAAYREFKELWTEQDLNDDEITYIAPEDAFSKYVDATPKEEAYRYIKRMAQEAFASGRKRSEDSDGNTSVKVFFDTDHKSAENCKIIGVRCYQDKVLLARDYAWDHSDSAINI